MSDQPEHPDAPETPPAPAKSLNERHAEWLDENAAGVGIQFQLLDGTLVDPANFLSHIPGRLVWGVAPLRPEQ